MRIRLRRCSVWPTPCSNQSRMEFRFEICVWIQRAWGIGGGTDAIVHIGCCARPSTVSGARAFGRANHVHPTQNLVRTSSPTAMGMSRRFAFLFAPGRRRTASTVVPPTRQQKRAALKAAVVASSVSGAFDGVSTRSRCCFTKLSYFSRTSCATLPGTVLQLRPTAPMRRIGLSNLG